MSKDVIADFLTVLRNGVARSKPSVTIDYSNFRYEIAKILKQEGFVTEVLVNDGDDCRILKVVLKYDETSKPVIANLKRVSKPGLRVYLKSKRLPKVLDGAGVAIVSTSKGLLSDRKARKEKVGGEVLCYVA